MNDNCWHLVWLMAGITLLQSCALSPQTIAVMPVLSVPNTPIGQGKIVRVSVTDARGKEEFGYRGGVYRETSFIKPNGPIVPPVREALVSALRQYGFSIAAQGQTAPVDFGIEIERVDYQAAGEPMVRKIQTQVALKAVCKVQGMQFESRYQARSMKDVLKAPSAAENRNLINGALSKALTYMMTDKGMLDCLGSG